MTTTHSTHCACGAAFPIHPLGYCGASGYAVLPTGEHICYDCADKRQQADLLDRSKPFVGYLNKDRVTTWTGGLLMRIAVSRPCRLTRPSIWHDNRSYRSIHAVDVHGGHWTGRGSDGVCIKMRPVKA